MSDPTEPFGDDASFRRFMEQHTSLPAGGDQAVNVPDLDALRARMDQFKALGSEVASVLARFRQDLRISGMPEDDVVYYSRIWGMAYMNLIWAQVQRENGVPQ